MRKMADFPVHERIAHEVFHPFTTSIKTVEGFNCSFSFDPYPPQPVMSQSLPHSPTILRTYQSCGIRCTETHSLKSSYAPHLLQFKRRPTLQRKNTHVSDIFDINNTAPINHVLNLRTTQTATATPHITALTSTTTNTTAAYPLSP